MFLNHFLLFDIFGSYFTSMDSHSHSIPQNIFYLYNLSLEVVLEIVEMRVVYCRSIFLFPGHQRSNIEGQTKQEKDIFLVCLYQVSKYMCVYVQKYNNFNSTSVPTLIWNLNNHLEHGWELLIYVIDPRSINTMISTSEIHLIKPNTKKTRITSKTMAK